jgi:hypothetical protein
VPLFTPLSSMKNDVKMMRTRHILIMAGLEKIHPIFEKYFRIIGNPFLANYPFRENIPVKRMV